MSDLLFSAHVLPVALALVTYLGAGVGALLAASRQEGDAPDPRRPALEHYLDTHTVPRPIEDALRRGDVVEGMTSRQVSLLRGVPRTRSASNDPPVLIYDARDARTPSWLQVRFDGGRVASVRRVPVAEAAA